MFLDRVKIRVKAGNGGDGVTAFRREKFVPRGGPSGGDGGVGGSVWIESSEGLNTLLHLRYNPEHKAERGRHGEGSNRSDQRQRAVVRVPVGTQVFDPENNELLFDFTEPGHLPQRGGKGGWGNAHFATPTKPENQNITAADVRARRRSFRREKVADVGAGWLFQTQESRP